MNHTIDNLEEILGAVSGFHCCDLEDGGRLVSAGGDLCAMTGYAQAELLGDGYLSAVHPGDREAYRAFLDRLGRGPGKETAQYRMVKKDGSILFVSDTMTARAQSGGRLLGYSVLTDITALKSENENLRYLNETMPCGFLKYTCEKTPRVTYVNDQMLKFLRFPQRTGAPYDDLEMYKQNVYMMIPVEERRKFGLYLERVYRHGGPIAGELTVLRCDGTRAHLFGWVTKCVNEQGVEEFQSACMDMTQRYRRKQEQQSRRYLNALTEVYDNIFEFDLVNDTVKCLHGRNSPMFRWLEDVPMQMEEATEKWIASTVRQEDREKVRSFFWDFRQKKFRGSARPPQVTYWALSSAGTMQHYGGIFLKLDGDVSLFCCRRMTEEQETDELRSENAALKNMQQLVMRFTEGVVAFEVENDAVKPLYVSDNVCSFFGYSQEQWLGLAEKRLSVREFISGSGVAYEEIEALFAAGEKEFTYFDMTRNTYRRIKAICSQKYSDGSPHCYVMLYNVEDKGAQPAAEGDKSVQIRTFGYFDVFVDGKPIAFRNEKSKELFALLVDRRGGFVSSEEAISFLWEDEPANSVTLARYRKVALRLKNILEEYGISHIVETVSGKRRIVTDRVRCDLYDYLSGREDCAQLFKGSYLTNYSWGENTLAELAGGHLYAE